MGFSILSHTADTGIEATGRSFAELMAELARGMFATMADFPKGAPTRVVVVEVEAESVEDLVVDVLSELIYTAETQDVLFYQFKVEGSTESVTVEAAGIPLDEAEQSGPPIKAVTYHDLIVEERPEGWYARVYFDV